MSDKHTMPSHLCKLEQEMQQLRVINEHLTNKTGKLNDRIRHLIKLGLETCEPRHRELWQIEEEL